MWPLPKIQEKKICLTLNDSHATIAWIETFGHKNILRAYDIIEWHASNKALAHQLKLFISKHQLSHSFLSISLASPLIYETIIRLNSATPARQEIATDHLKKMLWDYRYLHTLDNGQSLFYVCGINRATVFAQQLLAHNAQLILTTVTSEYMALIHAYSRMFGSAFRRSQLAMDLIKHDYKIEKSICSDSVARLLMIDPALAITIEEQKIPLLSSIGLFNQEL